MRDLGERLEDILEAIGHIERYAARGRAAFENDELIQNWFVRHLQIIGEAVRALSDEVRNAEPEIPWSKIIGMRHILVHDYFSIDTETVWSAIERDLPELKRKIEEMRKNMQETAAGGYSAKLGGGGGSLRGGPDLGGLALSSPITPSPPPARRERPPPSRHPLLQGP